MKKKLLMLGTHDINLRGHLMADYGDLKNDCDAKVITLYSINSEALYSFFSYKKIIDRFILSFRRKYLLPLFRLLRYGSDFKLDRNHLEYNYNGNDFEFFSAKRIIKKAGDFKPDYIVLYWTSHFLSSQVIRDLQTITGAVVVFVFVDQFYLSGGCHYSVQCQKFKDGCHDCPALLKGVEVPQKIFENKIKYLSALPKIIVGTPSDLELAKTSPIYRNSQKFIPLISVPQYNNLSRIECKKYFGISVHKKCVFVACALLNDKRKGITYAIEAINKAARNSEFIVLTAGNSSVSFNETVNHKHLGLLNASDLEKVFYASDCFLSPTIADSGPMMVNYSIAYGTPVVSFPVGIANTIVKHLRTGYVARIKDSEDFANGIEYICNLSDKERLDMRNNCLEIMDNYRSVKPWWLQL